MPSAFAKHQFPLSSGGGLAEGGNHGVNTGDGSDGGEGKKWISMMGARLTSGDEWKDGWGPFDKQAGLVELE